MATTTDQKISETRLFNAAIDSANQFTPEGAQLAKLGKATSYSSFKDKMDLISKSDKLLGEFVRTMFYKVSASYVSSKSFDSVFGKFRRQIGDIGAAIEETFVNFIKPVDYETQVSPEQFMSVKLPDIRTTYHEINRQVKYPFTINDSLIKQQIQDGATLSTIVQGIMESATVSNEADEQDLIEGLLIDAYDKQEVYMVEVGDIDTREGVDKFSKYVRSMFAQLGGRNRFNQLGVTNAQAKSPKTIVMDADVNASKDVLQLANVFNMSKAELGQSEIVLPSTWKNPNFVAFLSVDDWFVIANNKFEMTSWFNPETLNTNYYLHVWETISRSPYAGGVLFVKALPKGAEARLIADQVFLPIGKMAAATAETEVYIQESKGKKLGVATWTFTAEVADGADKFTATMTNNVLDVALKANVQPRQSARIVVTATPDEASGLSPLTTTVWVTAQ